MDIKSKPKLTVEGCIGLIDNEILWCKTHGDQPDLSEYQRWFVLGLQQARFLLAHAVYKEYLDLQERGE